MERRFLAILLKNVLFLKQPDERKNFRKRIFGVVHFFAFFPHLSSSSSSSRDCCRKRRKSLKKKALFRSSFFLKKKKKKKTFVLRRLPLL